MDARAVAIVTILEKMKRWSGNIANCLKSPIVVNLLRPLLMMNEENQI